MIFFILKSGETLVLLASRAYSLGLLIQPASGNSFPQPNSYYIQKGHAPQGYLFCDT